MNNNEIALLQQHNYTTELLYTATQLALSGTLQWEESLTNSINSAIKAIDERITAQLNAIIHHAEFKRIEASWRSIDKTIRNNANAQCKIKLLSVSKKELQADFQRAAEFDQSHFFKSLYEAEYGSPGGEPYAIVIGDYSFSHNTTDIGLLTDISAVCAASFTPFLAAAAPELLGLTNWSTLNKPRDLSKIFASAEYASWRSLRARLDSRFITLTTPRVLIRAAYSYSEDKSSAYEFIENCENPENGCWTNAAYALAERIAQSNEQHGWCTAIRGAEGGGKVSHLPYALNQNPVETNITDRREAELSNLGFLPLCYYKNTDYAVFFGAETLYQPEKYDNDQTNANAIISGRLPYVLAVSRFAHYLKVMSRDKIGSCVETNELENWLNRWILQYVNGNALSKQDLKSKYPLAAARISVEEKPGQPGCYHAVAWLRPWLQLEELTTSLRLVADIPMRAQ